MSNVLLIILLIISVILTGLILIQRSEGGALGIGGGGGGGGGGFMSGRGTANLVTRMTAIFGTAFMLVCLLISISFNYENRDKSLLDASEAEQELVIDEKIENEPLNTTPDSAKDDIPLADENSTATTEEQSEADVEEQPQDE